MLNLVLESVLSLSRATLSTVVRHTPRADAPTLGPVAAELLGAMTALHKACATPSPDAQLERALHVVRRAEALLDAAAVPTPHPTRAALTDAGALVERLLDVRFAGEVRYLPARCSTPPSAGSPTALAS